MVESNNDEERLARIERMVEALQREAAAFKVLAVKAARRAAIVAETASPVGPWPPHVTRTGPSRRGRARRH